MNANLQRFLGGSPGAVLVKLIFLSLLVGAFMALIGITPGGLFERAFLERIWLGKTANQFAHPCLGGVEVRINPLILLI